MTQTSTALIRNASLANDVASPEPTEPIVNPFAVAHRLLRGRYNLAITLAILGALLGGGLGLMFAKPVYRTAGMVRIRPYLPKILYPTEQSDVMPMFDAFMDAQVALIHSPRLVDLAMQDPRWKQLGRGLSPSAVETFSESLEVTRAGELITIAFTDVSADATSRATNATIDAYQQRFADQDSENDNARMESLERHRQSLAADMKRYNESILAIGSQYGSTELQKVYDYKVDELNKVQSQLRLAQLAVAAGEARQRGEGGPTTMPLSSDTPSTSQLLLKQYSDQKEAEQMRIRRLSLRLGENNPQIVEAKAFVAQLDAMIGSLSAELNGWPSDGQSDGLLLEELNSLRGNQQNLAALYEKIHSETNEIAEKSVQIETLKNQLAAVKAEQDETVSRIDKLKVEENVGDRFNVITYGEVPIQPFKTKRSQVAAASGTGGALLGFGIVLVMGLLDPRLRHIADAQAKMPRAERLLGVLPYLADDYADVEQSSVAAHCVHQIRTMLQIQSGPASTGRVLAITSPAPGDGKTSLTVALGMSFAATGAKTLLIDFDMQGGGLTARLNTSAGARRLGQILLRDQVLTDEQLRLALLESQAKKRKLGEMLVENNIVDVTAVEHALATQLRMRAGICGLVNGHAFDECVLKTNVPNLHLLPPGAERQKLTGQLSPSTIGAILDEAAKRFDTILVDTGPILASLEASAVASEADGVVLTFSRGGQKALAQHAINYLHSLGVPLEGIVFNRAHAHDISQSLYSSSMSSDSAQGDTSSNGRPFGRRLGPVANAMIPTEHEMSNA